MKHGVL